MGPRTINTSKSRIVPEDICKERQASSHTIGSRRTSTRVRGSASFVALAIVANSLRPRGAHMPTTKPRALYGYSIAEHMDCAWRIQAVAGRRHETNSEKKTDESSVVLMVSWRAPLRWEDCVCLGQTGIEMASIARSSNVAELRAKQYLRKDNTRCAFVLMIPARALPRSIHGSYFGSFVDRSILLLVKYIHHSTTRWNVTKYKC
ncbi:hypothetical protein BGZ57DRAFT_69230 [Hyaloscypha finlandica]|nr:hypothetical protein BGZ57DRAFT_69230 [Hyaloscypha finlandica]